VFCDSARPDSIEELYRMGWNVKGVGAKHVVDEINMIKEFDLYVTKDSLNGIKELRSYSWKTDKNGAILNEPVKFQDDFVDAMRYGIIPKIRSGYKLNFI
jgi:phage terminase large subunit